MLEPALYERIKDIPVKLRISFAVSNLNTQETQDVVISDDKFTVKNLGLCVLWNDNSSIECRHALVRHSYFAPTSALESTCPGVERPQPPNNGETEVWELAEGWGPAEFGISPVHTVDISMLYGASKPLPPRSQRLAPICLPVKNYNLRIEMLGAACRGAIQGNDSKAHIIRKNLGRASGRSTGGPVSNYLYRPASGA